MSDKTERKRMIRKKLKRWRSSPSRISSFMEHFMAILVFIGIAIATISLWDSFQELWMHRKAAGAFLVYIDEVFKIVIGIEFFKLLWKPEKETLIEVLMFVIARHMIIEHTTGVENLLSVIAIGILFCIEKYLMTSNHHLFADLHDSKEKEAEKKE